MDSQDSGRTIAALYDAAADPGAWSLALAEAARFCDADGAHFLIWDNRASQPNLSAVAGFDSRTEALYMSYYGAIDPRRQLIASTPVGIISACHEHFDSAFVGKSEFYNDFLIPSGGRYIAGARLIGSGEQTVIMAVHRGTRRGPFTIQDRSMLQRLLPHLRWTAELHSRLQPLHRDLRIAEAALADLAIAVVVVDRNGRIRLLNSAAEALLRQDDGLTVRHGRLVAVEPDTAARLTHAIGAATVAYAGSGTVTPRAVEVSRPSGRRPFLVMAMPLTEGAATNTIKGAAFIHIVNPDLEERPATQVLKQLFGFTTAEAELAVLLMQDKRPEEIATERDVRLSTVRTQLRALLAKTDTTRQAALVRLLGRLTATKAAL